MRLHEHLQARPRLVIALAVGLLAGWAVPQVDRWVTRLLVGWNVGVWLLLGLMAWMMLQADHEKMRRDSMAQAEGAPAVLALVTIAAILSIVAIIVELSAAKTAGGHQLPRVLFALVTIAGSWLLLPTLFSMNYASLYYTDEQRGLQFPATETDFRADYTDFLYFAFTIAVACQTADVSISTRAMRRLVLLQSVLSFLFNTSVLALAINIAASMF